MTPLLLAFALAATQAPPAQEPTEVDPVTVTARRSGEALQALKDCIARGCSPAEEMRLTLRSAEASFLAGDYKTARATLDRGIGRNKRHAGEHPVLLAGLYKADNTINRHLGRGGEAHRSARSAAILLAQEYGDDSGEALWARLDTADALLNANRFREARARYLAVGEAAQSRGSPTLRGVVKLRLAWLPAVSGRRDAAKAQLQALIDGAGPGEGGLALAAALLQVKLLPEAAQDRAAAEAIAVFRSRWAGGEEPTLLWSPVLDQSHEMMIQRTFALAGVPAPSEPDPSDWIDVGFFVNDRGKVQGAEVLRASAPRKPWHADALGVVRRRVYAPAEGARDPVYRVERLALTALVQAPGTGTRLPGRSIVKQLHGVDLTRAAAATPSTP